MPMKYDPDVIIENFKKIESHTIPNLSKFLRENFLTAGSEIMSWTPPDWVQNPSFIQNMKTEDYKEFALQVHEMWKALGKQLIPDVVSNPQRYSIIPQKKSFYCPWRKIS
jgi:alpha,alpha-trehalase